MKKLLSLFLALILLLSFVSCDTSNDKSSSNQETTTVQSNLPEIPDDYFKLVYQKSDYDRYLSTLNQLKTAAISGNDREAVERLLFESEELAEYLSTQHSVSNIIYYSEMTDEANEKYEEMDELVTLASAEYYRVYREIYVSESPYKDIIFADWTETELDSIANLDIDEYIRTRDKLNDILLRFNDLDDSAADWGNTVNELYFEHVKVANDHAKAWGYSNYYDYMTENAYCRDYTEADRKNFRKNVRDYIVPAYINCYNAMMNLGGTITQNDYNEFVKLYSTSYKELETNYVDGFINTFSGTMKEKMTSMFDGKHIRFGSKNSLEAAFTSHLEYYDNSVVFFSDGYYQSISTVVHEMGHYVSLFNYSYSGTSYDLLETHSQGTEWLLLYYLDGKISKGAYDVYFINSAYSLFDLLIRCAIIDEFEETVYKAATLYTADEYDALLDSICLKYGTGINEAFGLEDYIKQIFIRNPVYYLSYATSALSAADFYIIAQEEGYQTAQEAYRKLQEGNDEEGFLYNLDYAGLSNPFKTETFRNLCNKFEEYLK